MVDIETEFFPDSYDIGEVAGNMTICHLDRETQTVTVAQGETGSRPDVIILDLPAMFNLLSVLKNNLSDHGYIINEGNTSKHGLN